MNNQLIVSTLGFEKIKHRYSEDINIIELDNEKYKLLNENDYNKYYKYLFKLASINKDIQIGFYNELLKLNVIEGEY